MIRSPSLQKTVYYLLLGFLILVGLYYSKPFLVPVCFAGLLAMLFLPLCHWFESKKIPRWLSVLCCIIIFLGIFSGIVLLISWQINDLAVEATDFRNKLQKMINQIEGYFSEKFDVPADQLEKLVTNQAKKNADILPTIGSFITGFLTNFVLVTVYTYLFMYYRQRIKNFILQLVKPAENKDAEVIMHDIQKVSQQYLVGLGIMILCLWVMYSIGFSIVGVRYAVLFAVICGLLEIVPFIGNLTGNLLTILMVVIQGGGPGMVVGVVVTYMLIQFIQTYFLEPLVVGAEVNINPLFTIIILVIGELVWGVPGLILAIPLLAIVKIICDHVPSLKPYGYLVGSDKKKKSSFIKRRK